MKSTIWITEHSGKMANIRSISTNPLTNPFCMNMHNCGNSKIICTKCYATNLVEFRGSLCEHMENNSMELSYGVMYMDKLPRYTDELMRFNSFGEVIDNNHLINIFNICYANPNTFHVIYTKKPAMFEEFHHLKPDNLRVIESNFFVDEVKDKPTSFAADIVFNVVTPGFLKANPQYRVNCMQSCDECRKCYTKKTTIKSIVELIK